MADTPKIRFKGYTDDWEQHKVKDVAPLQRGFDLPTSQMDEGSYPVVMSNGIGGHHSQYKVKGPGIVTGRSGTIGKLHYIEDNYWPHNTALWVTDFYGNNQKFVYYMYQRLNLSQFSTGSGVPTLNRNDVHDRIIHIPHVSEQEKISEYLTALDHLITLHQRKCDETKELKKYVLQKMFPRNNKKNPEIRFAGFTDDWKQRKLGDVFEERNEQYPMNEDYPLMAFIANVGVAPKGERYDRSALINDEQGKKYKRTELGDFIYSSNNLEAGSIGLNNYGNACISPVYSIFKSKSNSDSYFLGRVLLRKEFISAMVQYRQGVVYGQWKIHESDFLNLDIVVPSLDEQRMIGIYFNRIDSLINLYQCKCDQLKEVKKFMLQNMFPQKG